jgi:NAD+ diphosphatase
MISPRSRLNLLGGNYIDRLAHWRKDEARWRAALADPNTLFVPVWRNQNLVRPGQGSMQAMLVSNIERIVELDANEVVLLGEFHQRTCFAIALTTETLPAFEEQVEAHDLRTIAGELPAEEAGLLAYARAMLHWRDRHRFCGRCGAVTQALQGGHVRKCTNITCGEQVFPRIDPAIIVLITDGERTLLGRQASWPQGRYSTIAGFVEPGESLEDAVIRESAEETGVRVEHVEYHSSQPWPFPSSLMLGFIATAATTEIRLADAELEDARWLTRQQIAAGEVALPLTHSISFRLIEDWYNEAADTPLREQPGVRMWRLPTR